MGSDPRALELLAHGASPGARPKSSKAGPAPVANSPAVLIGQFAWALGFGHVCPGIGVRRSLMRLRPHLARGKGRDGVRRGSLQTIAGPITGKCPSRSLFDRLALRLRAVIGLRVGRHRRQYESQKAQRRDCWCCLHDLRSHSCCGFERCVRNPGWSVHEGLQHKPTHRESSWEEVYFKQCRR